MHADLLPIRSPGVCFYVLRDPEGLYLIDGGFIGGREKLRRELKERGWEKERILGIIVTHGHLDHVLNVGALAEETGAWIAAPRLDADHYQGQACYRGVPQFTGWLEAVGRRVLGFRKFTPTRLLDEGDVLDVWGGLRTIHLPGHTAGHCGFYSESRKLLFCGDLFASYGALSHLPPRIFNWETRQIPGSVAKALSLDLEGVLPHHCNDAPAETHLRQLHTIHRRLQRAR
jgi:glyoxylase-like metal-dependent hydrolase (beta-lactamase superfamily II)